MPGNRHQWVSTTVDKKNSEELTFSQRLEILIELLQRRPIRAVLDFMQLPRRSKSLDKDYPEQR